MPAYEYRCRACGKSFEWTGSIGDYERRRARCPKCGSVRLERRYTGFFAQTSKKS